MINNDMRIYDYFQYGAENEYGQKVISKEPVGKLRMAIYITNQSTQDNINYKGDSCIGLTYAAIDDSFVIQYGEEKLKVLYVTPANRLKQVFMAKI